MAHLTSEQRIAIDLLRLDYGDPDRVAIEVTNESYGVVMLDWSRPEDVITYGTEQRRRILVRPDGTRLAWETVL